MDGAPTAAPSAPIIDSPSNNHSGQREDESDEEESPEEKQWKLFLPDGEVGRVVTSGELSRLIVHFPLYWQTFHLSKSKDLLSITRNEKKALAEFVKRVQSVQVFLPTVGWFRKYRVERVEGLFCEWARRKTNLKNLKRPVSAFLEQYQEVLSDYYTKEAKEVEEAEKRNEEQEGDQQ